MLILTTDRLESLKYMYRTLFEQSANLVKISAAVFDQDEQALQETGLVIKPEGGGIYCQDANGNMALIGAMVTENGKSKIVLQAEDIDIVGSMFLSGYLHKSKTIIDDNNWSMYINDDWGYDTLDVKKAGTYIIVRASQHAYSNVMYMPSLVGNTAYSQSKIDYVRGFVGNTVILYCDTDAGFSISGRITKEGEDISFISTGLSKGEYISLRCVCKSIDGYENVYWEFNKGTAVQVTDEPYQGEDNENNEV